MFNRKKRKIEELEALAKSQQQIIENKQDTIELLRKKLKGEHVCDEYCGYCVHGILNTSNTFIRSFSCVLECKCKDFRNRENIAVTADNIKL